MDETHPGSVSKGYSFFTAVNDAHARIDYLTKICEQLVLAAEPERRRELSRLLAQVAEHGVDEESRHATR